MKATYLDTGALLDVDELRRHGIPYDFIAPNQDYWERLDDWKQRRSYQSHDEVRLVPETPKLDLLLAKFSDEHLHTDDEVRYVVSGCGIFDIRSLEDSWMRVVVEAGDFIIVPANRYHRFTLTESKQIHAVRLFKNNPAWEPVYRCK